jgi:hypothetical protein
MDPLFRCISDPERLRVLALLLQEPLTQAAIGRRLARLRGVETVNPGSIHRVLQGLLDAGLVERRSPRGECSLSHPDATRALFAAIGGLAEAVAAAQGERSTEVARFARSLIPRRPS